MAAQSASGGFRNRFVAWLVESGAKATSIPVLLDRYCRFLTAEDYAIHRCNLATDTIHPQMSGTRHVWFAEATDPGPINPAVLVARRQYHMGEALIDEIFFNAAAEESPQYRASPFYQVKLHGELYDTVRAAGEKQPYPLFDDLQKQGCTAYYGKQLDSFAGMLQKIGLASRRSGALTPPMVADLSWSLSLLTLHLNTLIEFAIKNTLSEAYLGRDPGRRVAEGMIEVGNVIALDGAIWFSDLRGFTEASETSTPQELVAMLNTYFAEVIAPVYRHGGEVLKYIGDAILAVFPAENCGSPANACGAAMEAVEETSSALAALNERRAGTGRKPVRHGVGLHYGPALYGNIGSIERLDFTLIGREVNLASRIEGLTKQLDRDVLCSEQFARHAGCDTEPLGEFTLKGIRGAVKLHAPRIRDVGIG